MKIQAWMMSLQARLLAEGVPYEDLDIQPDISSFGFQVRMKIAKAKYLCFKAEYNMPIQLIRVVVLKAGLLALEVQNAR